MKIFAIRNEADGNAIVGYLFYYSKKKRFYIELPEDADEWSTPLLLSSFVRRKKKTVDARWSKIWVQQRIVPSDRQNIGQILRDNGLAAYDEYALLMLSMGRCTQDELYLEPIKFEDLPHEIRERRSRKIIDVAPLPGERLLVFFENGTTKLCDIAAIVDPETPLGKYLNLHPKEFYLVQVQTGGYGLSWGTLSVSDTELYESGNHVPLTVDDFRSFVSTNVFSTAQAAERLGCSRQNIDDLVKRGKLTPAKETEKGKLFLRSDVDRREWD